MSSINGISGQLFGRNVTDGLVHYLSKEARQVDFNGYAEASYERLNRRSLEGAVG